MKQIPTTRSVGIVGRANQWQAFIHMGDNFALVPNVVARGQHVNAAIQQFVGRLQGNSKSAGGIFAVGDHHID